MARDDPAPSAATLDRLPTVSAASLLESASATPPLATGLRALDALLSPATPGLACGSIIEIWGPSGSGKTTLALSLARHASHVTWLDMSYRLVRPSPSISARCVPSLPHLLSLLARPPQTALLVIENLSSAMDASFPPGPGVSGKRAGVLGALTGLLRRALATGVVGSVVVTATAGTRTGTCISSLGGGEWERAVWHRWVLFRDVGGRYLGVTKLGGKRVVGEDGEVGFVMEFGIDSNGLLDLADDGKEEVVAPREVSPVRQPRKRTFGEVVADSESDGDYGWDEQDEEEVTATFAGTEGLVDEDEDLIATVTKEREAAAADKHRKLDVDDIGAVITE